MKFCRWYLPGQSPGRGIFGAAMTNPVRSQWVLGLSGCYPHQNDGTGMADEDMTFIADIGHIRLIFGRICLMVHKMAILGLISLKENGSKCHISDMCENMS